jgi:subtilisin-like proprotein convertase family protein
MLVLLAGFGALWAAGASAQITSVSGNGWAGVYNSATLPSSTIVPASGPPGGSYPINPGTNRVLVVVISSTTSQNDTSGEGASVSWSNQSLTQELFSNADRGHAWVFTLNEAGIQAGLADADPDHLRVTVSGLSPALRTNVFAAVYQGVDQNAPLVSDTGGGTDNGPDATIQAGNGLIIQPGGLGIEILSVVSGTAPAPAISINANWTAQADSSGTGALGWAAVANTSANNTGSAVTRSDDHSVTPDAEHARASIALRRTLPPSFTSPDSASFTELTAGTHTVVATGTATITYAVTGALPAGVTFNPATQVLSGTPAFGTAGSYPLTFTATNAFGTANQSFTLNVALPGGASLNGVIHPYENGTTTTVTNNNCANPIEHTYVVTETFNVGGADSNTIAVGAMIAHPDREELRVTLVAPNGATQTLQTDVTTAGVVANLNVMYSANSEPESTGTGAEPDLDPLSVAGGEVRYRRLVPIAGLNTFYTGPANGTWRLRVCDGRNTNTANGSLQSSRLVLRNANVNVANNVCSSTSTYNWGDNGNQATFSSVTVDGITITQQAISGQPPNDAIFAVNEDFVTCTANAATVCNNERGAHAGYYGWGMEGLVGGNDSELYAQWTRFGFSEEVQGLSFQFLDVDRSGGFEDMARIEAFDALGGRVPYRMTLRGPANLAFAGDWAEGDANANNNEVTGNVAYLFDRPVKTIWMQYAQGDELPLDPATQVIAISDFSWCALDYGDAPSPYPVTTAASGPRHVMGNRQVFVGVRPDGESAGANSINADGDDISNGDETAAQSLPAGIPTYVPEGGQVCTAGANSYTTAGPSAGFLAEYCVVVNASNLGSTAASLVGWIDFNGDGDFADPGERSRAALGNAIALRSFATGNLAAGVTGPQILVWEIPTAANPPTGFPTRGQTVLRLRVSTDPTFVGGSADPQPTGLARDGEVEDHLIAAETLPVTLAYVKPERLDARSVRISWSTATEAGTLGYRIYQGVGERARLLTDNVVPSREITTLEPQDYQTVVTTSSDEPFYLEEISVSGRVWRYGPYAVGTETGARPSVSAPPWAAARAEVSAAMVADNSARRARLRQAGGSGAAEILVTETGLQRVAVADLVAAGANVVDEPVANLRLRRGDEAVPMRVVGSSVVTPGGFIEFYGEAVEDSLYTRTQPYVLEVAAGGMPWAQLSGAPLPGASMRQGWRTTSLNADRFYSNTAPNGDPWYFDVLSRNGSNASRQWTLSLPGVDRAAGGRLALDLWGGLGIPELAPDHRYRVYLNSIFLGEENFDGVSAYRSEFAIPANLLVSGNNIVRLELIQTGFSLDRIYVEGIEIEHKAQLQAQDGIASFGASSAPQAPDGVFKVSFEDVETPLACGTGCEQYEVSGFASTDLVALQVSSEATIELTDVGLVSVGGQWTVRMRPVSLPDQGAGRLVITERARAARPVVRPAIALDHPLTGGAADLLLISSARFAGSVGELVAARQAEGLSARVVTVDQIYAYYSDGIVDPEAIRRFVGEASLQLGTRYVLLVGGDTYDYFNRLGIGSISDVPTLYRKTHEYVNFAPADPAFGDLDGDGMPELSVGRLPARTAAELSSLLAKVLEPLPAAGAGSVLFVGERANPAEGIDYGAELDALATGLPGTWQSGLSRVYLDNFPNTPAGTASARAQVLSEVNSGINWVAYYGHSSPATWSRETLLDADFLPGQLNNPGQSPVVTEFGCWGGYFVQPTYSTMSHSWLLTPYRGARAVIASTGLTESSSDRAIARALISTVSVPGIRLGDALLGAQRAVWTESPERGDVIIGTTLLGDPSARLSPPN